MEEWTLLLGIQMENLVRGFHMVMPEVSYLDHILMCYIHAITYTCDWRIHCTDCPDVWAFPRDLLEEENELLIMQLQLQQLWKKMNAGLSWFWNCPLSVGIFSVNAYVLETLNNRENNITKIWNKQWKTMKKLSGFVCLKDAWLLEVCALPSTQVSQSCKI